MNGGLVPQGNGTRAQAAAIIERLCENVPKLPADTDLRRHW